MARTIRCRPRFRELIRMAKIQRASLLKWSANESGLRNDESVS